jgi:hypothetical protein
LGATASVRALAGLANRLEVTNRILVGLNLNRNRIDLNSIPIFGKVAQPNFGKLVQFLELPVMDCL